MKQINYTRQESLVRIRGLTLFSVRFFLSQNRRKKQPDNRQLNLL